MEMRWEAWEEESEGKMGWFPTFENVPPILSELLYHNPKHVILDRKQLFLTISLKTQICVKFST